MGMMGLHIGVRALKAQQRALDVIGHNIANVNTEGYSRQRAELATTTPHTMPSMNNLKQAGQVGTGVEVAQIVRLRESFIDERLRGNASLLGEWEQRAKTFGEVESIFNEPTNDGLRKALDKFWGALQELHNNPENGAVRANVREHAGAVTDLFSVYHSQLKEYQKALNESVKNQVNQVNTIAQRIADLNANIASVHSTGENANDLMDKRDLLIDQLSKIVNIEVNFDSRANANVTIGGFSLVSGEDYTQLKYVIDSKKDGYASVKWAATDNPLQLKSGELKGILDSRDSIVHTYVNQLNDMARNFIREFNTIHQSGYGLNGSTGIKFFEGTDASNIRVSTAILDPVHGTNNIAAALAPNKEADGGNAQRLSDLMHKGMMSEDKVSMNEYWGGIITKLGIDSQRATRLKNNNATIDHQLSQQRQSVSAVSLDEELANMIIHQQAYNAAAKTISTQSEMLDVLLGILK